MLKKMTTGLLALLVGSLILTGCSSKDREYDLKAIQTSIFEKQEELEFPATMELTKEEFATIYNVNEEDIEEVAAVRALMTAHFFDVLMVKVPSDKASDVLAAIETTYDEMFLYPSHTDYVTNKQVIEKKSGKSTYLFVVVAEKSVEIADIIKAEVE